MCSLLSFRTADVKDNSGADPQTCEVYPERKRLDNRNDDRRRFGAVSIVAGDVGFFVAIVSRTQIIHMNDITMLTRTRARVLVAPNYLSALSTPTLEKPPSTALPRPL